VPIAWQLAQFTACAALYQPTFGAVPVLGVVVR
jgi:hypothetical protein